MLFDFCGIGIDFKGRNDYFIERSSIFLEELQNSGSQKNVDMELELELVDRLNIPEGNVIVQDGVMWLGKTEPDEGYRIYVPNEEGDTTAAMLDTNKDWSKVKISCVESDLMLSSLEPGRIIKWSEYHTFLYIGIAFRNRLIKKNGLLIHSSAIAVDGKGIIFSAPSGTGKSTHTKLWKELFGDEVIYVNDDRPAVRFFEDIPMLCGIPWSGASRIFSDTRVPLNAIVMLERAPVNSIEKLDTVKALQLLMPRCFLPYYDGDMMNEAMSILEKIIEHVPVYQLNCRPDFEAVELVRRCLS